MNGSKQVFFNERLAKVAALVAAGLAFTSCAGDDGSASNVDAAAPQETTAPATERVAASITLKPDDPRAPTFQLTMLADGSFVFEGSDGQNAVRQDRATGAAEVVTSVGTVRNTGIPLTGPDAPDFRPVYEIVTRRPLSAAVLGAARDGKTTPGKSADGRDTITYTGTIDSVTTNAQVDAETGLVLSASALGRSDSVKGGPVTTSSISRLPTIKTKEPITEGAPGPFKVMSPEKAVTAVPYKAPKISIPGFTPSWAQVGLGRTGVIGGGEAGNPDSSDVMIVDHRQGFHSIVLTTRHAGIPDAKWLDPYDHVGTPTIEKYQPKAGAGAGTTFEIVTGEGVEPHAWGVLPGGVVVTIGGDAGIADLKAAVDSLTY
jgi:hypothetical protein